MLSYFLIYYVCRSVCPSVGLSVCLSVLCNVSWQLLQATHLCTRCECKGRTYLAHSLLVVTQQITRCSREGRTLVCSLNVCRDIMASSCFISHSFLGSCVREGCVCGGTRVRTSNFQKLFWNKWNCKYSKTLLSKCPPLLLGMNLLLLIFVQNFTLICWLLTLACVPADDYRLLSNQN